MKLVLKYQKVDCGAIFSVYGTGHELMKYAWFDKTYF